MRRTYIMSLQGEPEAAERAVTVLDKIFRAYYNVYGTKRTFCQYNRKTGLQEMTVALTANWFDGALARDWPQYTAHEIIRAWYRALDRDPELTEIVTGELVEAQ